MSPNHPRLKSERFRHRIKEIELRPIKSKYHVSAKLFVNNDEVCELPRIKSGNDLKWSRPIVCRDIFPEASITLEVCEKHTFGYKYYRSRGYTVSDAQDRAETTTEFPGAQWMVKLTLLTPATAKQYYDDALHHLRATELPPSALEQLGKARAVFEAILDFGGAVAEVHPMAHLVFSLCTTAWEKLKEGEYLKEDTQELLDGLTSIADLARAVRKNTKLEQLKDTIEDTLVLLEDVFIYVIERDSRNSRGGMQILRGLVDSSDRETVNELLGRFKTLRANFDSGVGVDTHGMVRKLDLHGLLNQLQPVKKSGYNLDRACMDGTREHIIADLVAWTEESPSTTSQPKCMLWIHGQAGIGKSSIASSICGRLADKRLLAASFFCKRDDPDLHDPLGIINTIVHGLASRCREYGEAVAAAIEDDRELCMAHTMHVRYNGLIKQPLQALKYLVISHSLVILVDALDECGTRESRRNLVKHLLDMSQLVPWLKVVVTSRPDGDIEEAFEDIGDAHVSSRNLHDSDASDDIRIYLEKELDKLGRRRGWEWPQGCTDRLCEKAGGPFIWASTVKRYIEGSAGFKIATERLNAVIGGQSKHRDLDKLYEQVIEDGMKDSEDDNRAVFCQCIGAIIAASTRQPLSLPDLGSLMFGQMDRSALEYVVESLGAVLHVDKQMGEALRFYHQSFVDYATDQSRSGRFYVNPGERNVELAGGCLRAMREELKFNICELETSHLFNSQVSDLDERVKSKISNQLSYSCAYWTSHLSDTPKGTLKSDMEALLNGPQVLYWLEVLSLLSRLDVGLTGLLELLDWLQMSALRL